MLGFMHHRRFACICVTGSLIAQVAACTSWRFQNIPPQQFTIQDASKPVRIVRRDGTQLTLHGARVNRDTLYGSPPLSSTGISSAILAIPLSDVRSIALREPDSGKTTLFVVGMAVLAAAAAVVVYFYIGLSNLA